MQDFNQEQWQPDDLARMNRVLRHRLRNLASGIRSSMVFLSQEMDDRLQPSEKEYFPLIIKACDSLQDVTLRMNLLFGDLVPGGEIAVALLLDHVLLALHERFPMADIKTHVESETTACTVTADECVRLALRELLVNAVEAAPGKEVSLAIEQRDGSLVFSVKDLGEDRSVSVEEMMQPFFTKRTKHLGIGLPAAQRMVRFLSGSLQLARQESGGMLAEIVLPAVPGSTRGYGIQKQS
jgi:signal transduction histidine kinase